MTITCELPPNLQKQVDLGTPGTDILHGELKWKHNVASRRANRAWLKKMTMEIDTRYWEGQLDALTHVYQLTYLLAFAIDDRRIKMGKPDDKDKLDQCF
jgi:hypothetical protein